MTFMSSLLATLMIATSEFGAAHDEGNRRPAAPPPVCEIHQSVWCIDEGASEIVRRFDKESESVSWTLSSDSRPTSILVILEPSGCRKGFSDIVTELGFGKDEKWQGRTWDRLRVRLKTDGSCDLTLLFSPFDGHSLEWAFSVGRGLLAACRDQQCTSIGPTPADVTDKFREQFRRPAAPSSIMKDSNSPANEQTLDARFIDKYEYLPA